MKWFKHDSNANMDAKLKKVRVKYGMEGYGLYWFCLELIAANVEKNNITFELEHDSELISHDTGIHYERVQEMMTYMVNLGLFEQSNGVISCLKMAKRLDLSMTSNQTMRKMIAEIKKNHDGVMTESCKNRIEENRIEEKKDIRVFPKGKIPRNSVPFNKIIELYHEILPELPAVEKLTDQRKGFIRQRWQEDLTDLEHWRNYFDFIRRSDFLMGRAPPREGKKPFRADLEWITRPGNFAKIAEEKYHG